MANKYDLKTWVRKSLLAAASLELSNACVGSDTAATGKTRFLTYIRVSRRATASLAGSMTVGVGDVTTSIPAASDVFAQGNLKTQLTFPPSGTHCSQDVATVQEIRGSIEHPIISTAGGTYMGIAVGPGAAVGTTVDVVTQYYDE